MFIAASNPAKMRLFMPGGHVRGFRATVQAEWAKALWGEGEKNMGGPTLKLARQRIKRSELRKDIVK